jgi:protein KTI12
MALITLTGFPCAGKTRRAEQIRSHLEAFLKDAAYSGPHLAVSYLSDDVLNIDRHVYDGQDTARMSKVF